MSTDGAMDQNTPVNVNDPSLREEIRQRHDAKRQIVRMALIQYQRAASQRTPTSVSTAFHGIADPFLLHDMLEKPQELTGPALGGICCNMTLPKDDRTRAHALLIRSKKPTAYTVDGLAYIASHIPSRENALQASSRLLNFANDAEVNLDAEALRKIASTFGTLIQAATTAQRGNADRQQKLTDIESIGKHRNADDLVFASVVQGIEGAITGQPPMNNLDLPHINIHFAEAQRSAICQGGSLRRDTRRTRSQDTRSTCRGPQNARPKDAKRKCMASRYRQAIEKNVDPQLPNTLAGLTAGAQGLNSIVDTIGTAHLAPAIPGLGNVAKHKNTDARESLLSDGLGIVTEGLQKVAARQMKAKKVVTASTLEATFDALKAVLENPQTHAEDQRTAFDWCSKISRNETFDVAKRETLTNKLPAEPREPARTSTEDPRASTNKRKHLTSVDAHDPRPNNRTNSPEPKRPRTSLPGRTTR